jgi:hypothetical protein
VLENDPVYGSFNMDNKKVLIALCMDRSGSMRTIAPSVILATNGFIHSQDPAQNTDLVRSDTVLGLLLFNDICVWVGDPSNSLRQTSLFVPISEFTAFNEQTYVCGGRTALYDAILKTMYGAQTHCDTEPDTEWSVIIVVQTDGVENQSVASCGQIHNLIQEKKSVGWQFTFLGANHNAFVAAEQLGIDTDSTLTYLATPGGTEAVANILGRAVSRYRAADPHDRSGRVSYSATEQRGLHA